jgi:Uma2 family endonuclease
MSDMAVQLEQRKITVSEYHRMVDVGILREGELVELLDGLLVAMSPIGHPHWAVHGQLVAYLNRTLAGHAAIFGQLSIPLGDFDEPQPDIAVLAPEPTNYFSRQATMEETFAVIEIANSSLAKDTGLKRDLYARFGIVEYLVVDLSNRELLRYVDSVDVRYEDSQHLTYGDTFSLRALPDVILVADSFLPPRA